MGQGVTQNGSGLKAGIPFPHAPKNSRACEKLCGRFFHFERAWDKNKRGLVPFFTRLFFLFRGSVHFSVLEGRFLKGGQFFLKKIASFF